MADSGKTIVGAITIVIITIVLLSLTPVIVAQVQSTIYAGTTPTATKWNFTGYSGALSILGLVPFVWVAGVLIAAVVGMMALFRSGKEK